MRKQKFSCERGGLTVRGTLYVPDGERLPAAVLCHGFMANGKMMRRYAKLTASLGYLTAVFDFCGGGPFVKSDGRTEDMTVLTERDDLFAVTEYLKGHALSDGGSAVLIGASQGGLVCALAAAERPQAVKKLVLLYPAFCIPDDARRGRMLFAKFDPANVPERIRCGPMTLGGEYAKAAQSLRLPEAVLPYGGPVLIVHGTKDGIVSAEYSREAAQAWRRARTENAPPVFLEEIEGAGHVFFGRHDRIAREAMRRFLERGSG